MRNMLFLACAVLATGCYAQHEPSAEPQRAAARRAIPIADAATPCSDAWVVTDAEEAAARPSCTAFCDSCASLFPEGECQESCVLRYSVASRNGCASDFPAWTECLASTCDASACLSARTCW